jgi:hypothetical protein
MKNSFKTLFFIFLLSVLLSSCSNDKGGKIVLLRMVLETLEDGTSDTTLLRYNEAEIASISGADLDTDFSYASGLITKIIIVDKATQVSSTLEYLYDADQLIQVLSPNNYMIKYTHNKDKTVDYERISLNSENQYAKRYHGKFYFKNKNLVKDERIFDDAASSFIAKYNVNFQYDSKKKPYYSILGYSKLRDRNEMASYNNVVSSVIENSSTNAEDQIISSAKFLKSSFKYDADGYPGEQITETRSFGYLKSQYFY